MKRKNSRRTSLSLLLTGLLVVSTITLGGAALSFAKSSPTVTDGDWTANRANSGRTGATTGTGPSGPYAGTDWSVTPDGRPSGAVVEGDTVYLGVETFDEYNRRNGKVVAYDAQTGEVRWNRTDLGGVDESPAFANGTVYVTADGVTDTDNVLNESGTPGLFALDADTGETKWRNNETKTWTGTPTVVGDTVYAHSGTTIYAIDAETGQTADSFELDADGDESPNVSVYNRIEDYAVVGDTAYLSVRKRTMTRTKVDGEWEYNSTYSGELIALNTTDWSREWTNDADSKPSGLAVTNGAVYWTVQPSEVYSFAADDGTQRWHEQLDNGVDDSEPDTVTAPAIADGHVYVATDDDYTNDESDGQEVGTVHSLDAQDGQQQWRFETAMDVDSAPTVTADTVYVGGDYPSQYDAEENIDGNPSEGTDSIYSSQTVYALNRNDGSARWSYAMGEDGGNYAVRATVPANGHLYVWTQDQYVYPQDGLNDFYALNASDERPDDRHRLADDEPQANDEKPVAQITTAPEEAGSITFGWGAQVTLNASTSGDRDGEIVSTKWDIDGDGSYERSGETADVTTDWCGERTVTLRVTDDDSNTDTTTVTLTTDCSPTRTGLADDDWSQVRNDPARTGSTDNAGPSGQYADEVWNRDVSGANGAVVHDDTVYVGSRTYSDYNQENGQLVASNATTGGLLWQRTDLGAVYDAPVVVGDTVFVSASVAEEQYRNGEGGTGGLFALDAKTGETKWHRDSGSGPVYADGRLYVTTDDGVEAVDPDSGTTLWTASNVSGSLSVADGTVYALGSDVTALDAETGNEQWSVSSPADRRDVSGYAVSNDVVYLTANPDTVYALSADDGSVLWTKTAEHSLSDSSVDRITAPAVDNGTVYVGTDDNYDRDEPKNSEEMGAVHAYDAQTGDEVWRFETAADIQGPPTVADGQVYVGGEYASQDAWENDSGYGYGTHPSKLIGTVYSSSVVYSLDADSGTESWSYAVPRYTNDEMVRGLAVANGDVFAWTSDDETYSPRGELFVLTASDEMPTSEERLANDSLYEQNSAPNAVITTQPPNAEDTVFEGGETVSLDASNSTDDDGHIVSYEWDLDGDGEFETTGTTANVTVPNCASIEVTLRVTDDRGASGTRTVEFRAE